MKIRYSYDAQQSHCICLISFFFFWILIALFQTYLTCSELALSQSNIIIESHEYRNADQHSRERQLNLH